MSVNTQELRQNRNKLIKDARAVLDSVEAEKRSPTQEELTKVNSMMADADKLQSQYEAEERLANHENNLTASASQVVKTDPAAGQEGRSGRFNETPEYRAAFDRAIRQGRNALNAEETRALTIGVDTEGGVMASQSVESKIIIAAQEQNIMRQLASVITVSTDKSFPIETDEGEAYYEGETKPTTESSPAFGKLNITAHKVDTLVKVSEELLKDAGFDLESYIANLIGRRFGKKEESKFINGNGVGCPTGLFGRGDVGKTTASASAITSDEIVEMFHSVAYSYRVKGSWIAADSTIKTVRLLKNSVSGDYMWVPGLRDGEPDRLLGRPIFSSDYAPAIAASAKVMAFGDMKYYQIVDREASSIQRLNELYIANGLVGFRAYKRNDGNLTLTSAVKVMQMHA